MSKRRFRPKDPQATYARGCGYVLCLFDEAPEIPRGRRSIWTSVGAIKRRCVHGSDVHDIYSVRQDFDSSGVAVGNLYVVSPPVRLARWHKNPPIPTGSTRERNIPKWRNCHSYRDGHRRNRRRQDRQ